MCILVIFTRTLLTVPRYSMLCSVVLPSQKKVISHDFLQSVFLYHKACKSLTMFETDLNQMFDFEMLRFDFEVLLFYMTIHFMKH